MTRNEIYWKREENKEAYKLWKGNLQKELMEFERLEKDPIIKFDEYLDYLQLKIEWLKTSYLNLKKLDMIEFELEEFEENSISEEEYKKLASYIWEHGCYPDDEES